MSHRKNPIPTPVSSPLPPVGVGVGWDEFEYKIRVIKFARGSVIICTG